ncbi:hypothetical protein O1611_g5619 [Lasiodiplodia mahajangana]|uniref:Uncharacterized protein n=1 Tax=Lasiodiplodia mahajangana TaxID=1108764 RepID=A0ACC2JLE5_9PEZI|nr:hypothetical protein O1611_g5619 [Lasiodiplodia mahajangana]
MAPRHRKRLVPCANCRGDGRTPCAHCQKTNSPCLPLRKQRPFRFKNVLPNVHTSVSSREDYPEASASHNDPHKTTQADHSCTGTRENSPAEVTTIAQTLSNKLSTSLGGHQSPDIFTCNAYSAPTSEPHESPRIDSSSWPANSIGSSESVSNESTPGFQEACLVRCFVEHLADAFDTTDQFRAYKTIVPQEARRRPLLLNAICTAAAGYLTVLQSAQNPEGVVCYNGLPLPNLNKESTIHYHNTCISYMIDYLNHPSDPLDDVLIAIPILRYHEQVDMHLTGSDSETYSNALGAIFRAKQSSFMTHLSDLSNYGTSLSAPISKECALRRSACLIALRQEITGVLCYRRPVRLSLPARYYNGLASSQKDTYDDYDWINHILIWCAYVLKHYYGSEKDADTVEHSGSRHEQWESLRAFERQWELLSPNPLTPFFYKERDPNSGQFFPIIWQANEGRVVGMQLIEFGRIVLAAHDLKHQILGLGAALAIRAAEKKMRQSTRIICGLAVSHRIQPAMTGACTAISLCGEYFRDPREQAAITDLMATIERDYAWSTSSVMASLSSAWRLSRKGSEDLE